MLGFTVTTLPSGVPFGPRVGLAAAAAAAAATLTAVVLLGRLLAMLGAGIRPAVGAPMFLGVLLACLAIRIALTLLVTVVGFDHDLDGGTWGSDVAAVGSLVFAAWRP